MAEEGLLAHALGEALGALDQDFDEGVDALGLRRPDLEADGKGGLGELWGKRRAAIGVRFWVVGGDCLPVGDTDEEATVVLNLPAPPARRLEPPADLRPIGLFAGLATSAVASM